MYDYYLRGGVCFVLLVFFLFTEYLISVNSKKSCWRSQLCLQQHDLFYAGSPPDDLVGRTNFATVFKGSVWIRRRNMLRWSLPETTVKFDVYSVVTGSVTPASCCCFSLLHPTGLEDGEPQSSGPSKLVLTAVTHYVLVTFHFRPTG